MNQRISESATQRILDAAARLADYGYAFDARLCDGGGLLGCGKPLDDGILAIVQFQQRGTEWTINLLRVKSTEMGPHVYGGYAGALGARLGYVLWFIANVRDGANPDRWWAIDDLGEALDLLIEYGLPWLENPHAAKPWEMPTQRWSEFAAAVTDIAGPELLAQGYRAATQSLTGRFPYPYFVKPLAGGEYALIEFQSIYSLDPAQFSFDVRLQRKMTDNPLDFGGAYGEWRAASLGQLEWQHRFKPDAMLTVEAVKSLLWQYADRVELADRLREALGAIKWLGLRWLEGDPDLRADHAADTI